LITSLSCLAVTPDFAVETLRTLAAYQGERDDEWREEEPGKIFHELRRGELARAGEVPHSPYYGTIDATPLFLILLRETFRWTGAGATAPARCGCASAPTSCVTASAATSGASRPASSRSRSTAPAAASRPSPPTPATWRSAAPSPTTARRASPRCCSTRGCTA